MAFETLHVKLQRQFGQLSTARAQLFFFFSPQKNQRRTTTQRLNKISGIKAGASQGRHDLMLCNPGLKATFVPSDP